jgi:hypothetical protein
VKADDSREIAPIAASVLNDRRISLSQHHPCSWQMLRDELSAQSVDGSLTIIII